jgi:FkbM family methyltransferase
MSLRYSLSEAVAWCVRSLPVRGRWRIAAHLNRLLPADKAEVHLAGVGRVALDLGVELQRHLYWAGVGREDARIARLICGALPPDGVFLDVGANVGIHTLAAARRLAPGRGAVLAFEPHPANYRALVRNVALNGYGQVTAENLGLSDAHAVLTGASSPDGGNWSLASEGAYCFEVRLVPLDDYLQDHPVSGMNVVKIDVEGAEVQVLRGARRTFARFRPLIVFEVCSRWLGRMKTSKEELFDELHAQGYAVHALPGRNFAWGPRMAAEDLDGLGADAWVNLVAAPRVLSLPSRASLALRSGAPGA